MAKSTHFDPQQESLRLASLVIFLLAIIPLVLLAKGSVEWVRSFTTQVQVVNANK